MYNVFPFLHDIIVFSFYSS